MGRHQRWPLDREVGLLIMAPWNTNRPSITCDRNKDSCSAPFELTIGFGRVERARDQSVLVAARNQVILTGKVDCHKAVVGVQLSVDVLKVLPHCFGADAKTSPDSVGC